MLLPVVGGVFLALSMMLLATRGYYSRPFLFVAFGFTVSWLFVGGRIERRKKRLRFGVLPFGHARAFQEVDAVDVEWIERGDRTLGDIDALVVDLHAPRAVDWSRYMAEAALQGVPVIHSVLAFEALTGRVSLTHLTPLHIGGYRPSPLILWFKRVVDVIVSLLLLPVALPIVAIAAAVIRLDSPGSPLFAQERVGAGGTPFTMYKLRTMRLYDGPPVMAEEDDPRITRIGKFLRKVRIDELPQLINVLKGDMSLIGPRLEQVSLTRDFESIIPLFGYRHLVRPGITGWAQVTQGYASGVSSTRDKLEHDFYYIKHLSLWLELLVLFKTVRTILTGFGAR